MFKNKFHIQMSWPELIVEALIYILPGIAAVSVGASLVIAGKVELHDILCAVASLVTGLVLFELIHPRGVALEAKNKPQSK